MTKNKLKPIIIAVAAISVLFLISSAALSTGRLKPAITVAGLFDKETPDHLTGRYTTIVDEQGNTISMMARMAFAGDEIYTAEGRTYRVEKVEGDRAVARFVGLDQQITAYNELYSKQEIAVSKMVAEQKPGRFAVYHTHSDESYVPSDGTEAIPFKGGIYQVGKTIVDRLQQKGMDVNYDQTPHDPHDNNAYTRSRRTAANLMKTNPVAIFDVHRDGIPDPSYYRANIDGKDVAKLRLVVGRENPRMSANMDFAKRMMAAVNSNHPNVVKEIFVGKGDYNQDLSPTALLIEAGTHTNTKEEAERGVDMFAESLPAVLGLSAATPAPGGAAAPSKSAGATRGSWKALGWIIGLVVVGGLAFLLISAGNMSLARQRLSGFGRELFSAGKRQAPRKPEDRSGRDNG
ncbi:MAG: stage II sporulation protein P [Firmicutes bacterium]|nr:stage II sporulation protein P [Bacillota bacterium]